MDTNELRQLLEKTDDKLSIFGNVEMLRQCNMKLGELYDTITIFLTDDEILKLFEYEHFQKWDSYRKIQMVMRISDSGVLLKALQDEEIIKDVKSWDLEKLIAKLNDQDKGTLLNIPDWFKNHGFSKYKISDIISEIKDEKKYELVSNPTLMFDTLDLEDNNVADIIATFGEEEDKDKLLSIYQLEEYMQVQIITTYSDEGKEEFLLSNSQLGKSSKISILKSFNVDNLIKYINDSNIDLSIYEITKELDESKQAEFVSRLDTANLTEDEKREILATLKPETKKKIDNSKLAPSLVNALNMETKEYSGKIVLDLDTDLEKYRGLDKLISVNPTRFDEKEKARFMQLCTICPQLSVTSTMDSKEDEKEWKVEMTSTASEYLAAEEWVTKVINLLKPEYTNAQKIALIDHEIGKRISYSPDFETEVSNIEDCRAIYKIISSGYGVCNGIARVEQYLFEKAGLDIECEIVGSGTHAFIKLKDMEFELSNGETVIGTTILDPTWNLTAHRFNGRPNNFCMSYDEARKRDIDKEGKDHKCHKNDEMLSDATFNLDDASLRNLFKSVGLADKDGNFPIKDLIDQSSQLHQMYADNTLRDIEEQFLLLKKVCPEFASCQNSTMSILQSTFLDSKSLKYEKCAVNRVYDKSDKDKRPITFVYINLDGLGEKFYYADKEKGAFIYLSKKEFLEQFECYEEDLKKSNGIKPWEQSEQNETKIDLSKSSGSVVAQKEEEER